MPSDWCSIRTGYEFSLNQLIVRKCYKPPAPYYYYYYYFVILYTAGWNLSSSMSTWRVTHLRFDNIKYNLYREPVAVHTIKKKKKKAKLILSTHRPAETIHMNIYRTMFYCVRCLYSLIPYYNIVMRYHFVVFVTLRMNTPAALT